MAHIRLRCDDVEAIQQGTLCANIVGLFSTSNAREPVFLRSLETLFVHIPNKEERADKEENENLLSSAKDTDEILETHKEQTKDQKKDNIYSKKKKKVKEALTPFSVVAHHSYVTGMRVTGVINRAIVHLRLKQR